MMRADDASQILTQTFQEISAKRKAIQDELRSLVIIQGKLLELKNDQLFSGQKKVTNFDFTLKNEKYTASKSGQNVTILKRDKNVTAIGTGDVIFDAYKDIAMSLKDVETTLFNHVDQLAVLPPKIADTQAYLLRVTDENHKKVDGLMSIVGDLGGKFPTLMGN